MRPFRQERLMRLAFCSGEIDEAGCPVREEAVGEIGMSSLSRLLGQA
jgi:hypothetical protein